MLLALRYYGRETARIRRYTVPAMLLTSLGATCISYIAPLVVAQLERSRGCPGTSPTA